MKYYSTRDKSLRMDSAEAVKMGCPVAVPVR